MSLSLKLLHRREFGLVRQTYESVGGKVTEFTAAIAVAFDEDKVVGLFSMQFLNHAGQLWVHPDYRKRGIAKQLGNLFEQLPFPKGSSYIMLPSTETSAKVAASMGLEKTDWQVWKRTF